MEVELLNGLIGAVVGAIFGFTASFLTLRFNYHQLFAETVSKNRMEWINVWRENISKFLACAEILQKCSLSTECDNCKIVEYKKEFYESRAMITSRLNMGEELHVLMFAAINQIDFKTPDLEFVAKREYILELARKILKPEWERVKKEAKGKE